MNKFGNSCSRWRLWFEASTQASVKCSSGKGSMGHLLMTNYILRPLSHKSSFIAILILISSSSFTCNGQSPTKKTAKGIDIRQLAGLHALWGAWNESTPDLEKNLPGWTSKMTFPCSESTLTTYNPSWRGVECLNFVACPWSNKTMERVCLSYISGLTLDNAFIVGNLPPEIENITTLTTLALTGNPRLTGTLPDSLASMPDLYNVDLHDDDFYGEIPDFNVLKKVNLRGNRFNGSGAFPLPAMRSKGFARTIVLGSNDLGGVIPDDAFQNSSQLVQLDLSNNRFNGTAPSLWNATSLEVLDLSDNKFTGALPNLTLMAALRSVNLSRNAFTGSVPGFRNNLALQELDLGYNTLSGSLNVSDFSARGLLSMRSSNFSGQLRVLSLTNNNISDVIYDVTKIGDFTTDIRLQGNPYCKDPDSDDGTRCFCTQVCRYTFEDAARAQARRESRRKIRRVVIISVATSVTSLLVLLAALAAFHHRSKKYRLYCQLQLQRKCEEFEVQPTIFPYHQLRIATRDFHPDMKLGQGAFGAVYKGTLPNGSVVAVKQLFAKTTQSIDEFLNEVVLLTGMRHRNLVNLKGCCIREQQRLLVYEYVDNYDIDKILLSSREGTDKAFLSWPTRLKICLGVARGLHYLHKLAQPRIIHRDIKPSNILLSRNYETKIADFGLAFLFPNEESYILTQHVAGTKGYLAPEYASLGQLSDKVDVFSFGIVCLEVVSGRRIIDKMLEPYKVYLSNWAWELHRQGKLIELSDPTMNLQEEEKMGVERLINIALLCIQSEAELRPHIEQIVAMIEGKSHYEALAPTIGMQEQYLETLRLFASAKSTLATMVEESESSINSLKRTVRSSRENYITCQGSEFSEITII